MTRQFEGTENEFVYDSEVAPNMQPVSMSMFASKDDMLRHLLKEREQTAALITSQAAEIERLEKADETRAQDISRLTIERDAARDRLAEALKALEPFALVAKHDIGESDTDDDLFRPMERHNRAPRLTVGHLRAARRVREGSK